MAVMAIMTGIQASGKSTYELYFVRITDMGMVVEAWRDVSGSDPSAGDIYGREAGRQEFYEAYERDMM